MKDGQFRVPGRVMNGDGEKAGIFVVHASEFDALVRAKRCQTEPIPVE